MSKLNRRTFIKTAGAATAAAAGPKIAFGGSPDPWTDNILVFIFQRGGLDGLSFMAPMIGHDDRTNYETLRSNGTLIPGASLQATSDGWGLHPAAAPLLDLYTNNSLALVHAVGLPWANRSHFEAERYIELGTPGNRFTTDGWLTRHLQTAGNLPDSLILPAVVTESTVRLSLLREPSALTLKYPSGFDFETSHFEEEQEAVLASIYDLESDQINLAGSQALAAMDLVETIDFDSYTPANGASYPVRSDEPQYLTSFGSELKIMAQLIKEDAGTKVCATDIGGWDTHNDQGNNESTGWFWDNVRDMSEGLLAFFTDLDVPSPNGKTWAERVTCICCSEFGRRAYDNNDAGTDHGWGNCMMVIGGGVNGGQLYGDWPGIGEGELFQNADIWATTDYRSVFTEVLLKRLHSTDIRTIFPGFEIADYQPRGVVSGSFTPGNFDDPEVLFRDGGE